MYIGSRDKWSSFEITEEDVVRRRQPKFNSKCQLLYMKCKVKVFVYGQRCRWRRRRRGYDNSFRAFLFRWTNERYSEKKGFWGVIFSPSINTWIEVNISGTDPGLFVGWGVPTLREFWQAKKKKQEKTKGEGVSILPLQYYWNLINRVSLFSVETWLQIMIKFTYCEFKVTTEEITYISFK